MEKIKVIIADDSAFVRDGMKIILDVDDDFDVIGCASNGREAIEIAKKERPDVFLMDIQMPEMDGYEATRTIRALENEGLANIPIIAMTANAFREDADAALEAGMQAHIAKPLDNETLFRTLESLIRGTDPSAQPDGKETTP